MAFDKPPHERLSRKILWFYQNMQVDKRLANRKRVILHKKTCELVKVCGVPQVSVLGPVFNVYKYKIEYQNHLE